MSGSGRWADGGGAHSCASTTGRETATKIIHQHRVTSSTEPTIPVRGGLCRQRERGAWLVEYTLLVALIAVVCITAVTLLGTSASGRAVQGAGC